MRRMNIVTALVECAKDPLAGGYLYGFIAAIVGLLLQSPVLFGIGIVAVVLALSVGGVMAIAG